MARTIAEIEQEIEQVKQELADVHGMEAEVYARIVGYYRSVRNWNKGKREEYNERKMFAPSTKETDALNASCALPDGGQACGNATAPGAFSGLKESALVRVELFTRKTCPNCPPVKEYVEGHFEDVRVIDVDSAEGLARAQECSVLSTPTVIFYADDNAEITRVHTLSELKAAESAILSTAKVSA